ncbi:MAG TPA: PhzF family phenazine biosynthesis protein [Chloroflexota bacterium]|jgi:PhzF family phenazine biosynthesis protein
MSIPLYQVDAFSDRPFAGSPAAVCLLDRPADEAWMQALGAEMNLSETAFLHAENDGFRLRWFTPTVEVALCGHATLASAHILWETGRLPAGATARFYTQSGLLTARRDGEWIDLDFPAVACEPAEAPSGLLEALGVKAVAVFRAGPDYVVELGSEAEVRAATPDLARLSAVSARGIAITAPASLPGYDIASRFFAPAAGIPEDPVTGSLHCALAPLWSARLAKPELTAYQASARGGTLRLRLAGDRVLISGQAVTIFRADLL